ncbi:uncharacterized protein NPIL_307611 [Nephila pilipes]|uniref:Gustatory receptor n=1 Tax=Nephila pilipes TaxID=299642 RepID=A0A8X6PJX0_NEPPI|nr:uncharacterized protein NPIL_307611 [Nephila pilipes]
MIYTFTKIRENAHCAIDSSASVPEKLKDSFTFMIDMFWVSYAVMMYGIVGSFVGYYCYVCICIKSCIDKFLLKSEALISECDYKSILSIHEDISQVMALANEFLSFPAFINVFCSMCSLFAASYTFIFYSPDDRNSYLLLFQWIIQSFMSLLLLMIPAAGCNRSLIMAQKTVNSLPGWLPEHRKVVKMYIRKMHRKALPLMLWNIYVIDESLLISAFGTLLTYGFLLGNITIAKN